MNFLAHSLIPTLASGRPHPELIAGGFVGDFLKGRVPETLPEPLATGIRLHRRIDAFSNLHPGIRRSCNRFPQPLRRFAPVVVDVLADHLLAQHWAHFYPEPLAAFTATVYLSIRPHFHRLPEHGQRFFHHMTEQDLLAGYRDHRVMRRSLDAVLRRLRRSELGDAMEARILLERPGLEADFLEYFPDLIAHAREWLGGQPGFPEPGHAAPARTPTTVDAPRAPGTLGAVPPRAPARPQTAASGSAITDKNGDPR